MPCQGPYWCLTAACVGSKRLPARLGTLRRGNSWRGEHALNGGISLFPEVKADSDCGCLSAGLAAVEGTGGKPYSRNYLMQGMIGRHLYFTLKLRSVSWMQTQIWHHHEKDNGCTRR